MKTENAKILSTMIGYEDHGILTCMLRLGYDSAEQGFGGYALDEWRPIQGQRIPTDACGKWIVGILKVVGVDSWEKLIGKYVRVEHTDNRISRIGNIIKDEWFDPNNI